MFTIPNCPKCQSSYVYEDQLLYVCPECAHEWEIASASDTDSETDELRVIDSNGTPLQDGDSVVVIKDLKVKGASNPIKVGSKVKNIRLIDGDHNIDCKIAGFGAMQLKSEFVKKAAD